MATREATRDTDLAFKRGRQGTACASKNEGLFWAAAINKVVATWLSGQTLIE